MITLVSSPPVAATRRDGPIPLDLTAEELRRKLDDQVGVLVACSCAKAGADEAPIGGSLSRNEFHSMLGTLDQDADIALYCLSCIDDFCARWTASALRRAGYRWARVLVGGGDFR